MLFRGLVSMRKFLLYNTPQRTNLFTFAGCSFVSVITVNALMNENDKNKKIYE